MVTLLRIRFLRSSGHLQNESKRTILVATYEADTHNTSSVRAWTSAIPSIHTFQASASDSRLSATRSIAPDLSGSVKINALILRIPVQSKASKVEAPKKKTDFDQFSSIRASGQDDNTWVAGISVPLGFNGSRELPCT